jgi:hypothetical protein
MFNDYFLLVILKLIVDSTRSYSCRTSSSIVNNYFMLQINAPKVAIRIENGQKGRGWWQINLCNGPKIKMQSQETKR